MSTEFRTAHLRALLKRIQEKKAELNVSTEELVACEEELKQGEFLAQTLQNEFRHVKPPPVVLSNEESAFRSLINVMPDLVFQKDLQGCYVNCNEAFADYVGRSCDKAKGLRPRHLFSPKAARILEEDDNKVFMFQAPLRTEAWATDARGKRHFFDTLKTPYYSSDGELLGLIGVSRDMTKRRNMEEELRKMAMTDGLTGLLNRRSVIEKAKDEINRALRYRRPLSVLMLDIDHFKSINDTRGHDAGDEALRQTAERCHEVLRQNDIFGRYGGEEFLVILPETKLKDAMVLAERLRLEQSSKPLEYQEHSIFLTISLGVSSLKLDQKDSLDSLLKRADVALYQAKDNGRNITISG